MMRPWRLFQRCRRFTSHALWVVPFSAIFLELIVYRLLHALDEMLGWQVQRFSAAGAQALLETIITMTLSFVVFTFGSLLVAIQVAGGQLTPRVIATTLLRNNVVRYTVGLFVFTLLFAISALNRIKGTGDQLVLFVAGLLGLLSIATFLYLIDYAARLLRPVSILSRVGEDGLTVIEAVYPQPAQGPSPPHIKAQTAEMPSRIVHHGGRSEVILSVNTEVLLAESQKANAVVELIPVVGDFVGKDEPLFALYGNVSGNRRKYTGFFHQLWNRTHAGAGSDLCIQDYPRYRVESSFAGNQRSDYGRAGNRPASALAPQCRRAKPANRQYNR